MSQNDLIYAHLLEHGTITSLEAVRRYGITRLAARISDLKRKGIEIHTRMEKVPTRTGRAATVAVYSLEQ